ncbi:MAG: hypothetical protein AB7G51_13815 [Steroidobacteraceae bacterium]
MQEREIFCDDFHFNGKMTPALTASVVDGFWAKADTSAGGSPTLTAAGGEMVATLVSTNEIENLCLYHGDILSYNIDNLVRAEYHFRATCTAAGTIVIGMASARADDPDAIAAHAHFRLDGATNALKVETDDGVNDVNDIDTGIVLPTARTTKLVIDFASGLQTLGPPSNSLGGKGAVQFFVEDSRGQLRRVCKTTAFNMSNYSAGLQPYMQVQKTASVDTPVAQLRRVRIYHRLPAA